MEDGILRFARNDQAVKAKAFIEIINSLDCAKGHIEYGQSRLGWVARLQDALTGAGPRRQSLINQNLLSGFESLWSIAKDLGLNQTNLANVAATLADDIGELQNNAAFLGEKWLELSDELIRLRSGFERRLEELERDIRRVECIQKAQLQLESCASRLKSGQYDRFSPPGRLCLVAAHLFNGPFYDAMRHYADIRRDLLDMAIAMLGQCMADAIRHAGSSPQPWRIWWKTSRDPIEMNILTYLAGPPDFCGKPITAQIINQQNGKNDEVPAFISPNRLAARVIGEFFGAMASNA